MQIRELDATHRADAVALWHRTGLTRPWNPAEADFDRAAGGVSSAVLGGFEGELLVATAMVGHDGHRAWVYYLAVEPDLQASGLGRAMMRAVEGWAIRSGLPKLQLMVRSDNAGAHGFYEALGFGVEETSVLSKRLEDR